MEAETKVNHQWLLPLDNLELLCIASTVAQQKDLAIHPSQVTAFIRALPALQSWRGNALPVPVPMQQANHGRWEPTPKCFVFPQFHWTQKYAIIKKQLLHFYIIYLKLFLIIWLWSAYKIKLKSVWYLMPLVCSARLIAVLPVLATWWWLPWYCKFPLYIPTYLTQETGKGVYIPNICGWKENMRLWSNWELWNQRTRRMNLSLIIFILKWSIKAFYNLVTVSELVALECFKFATLSTLAAISFLVLRSCLLN